MFIYFLISLLLIYSVVVRYDTGKYFIFLYLLTLILSPNMCSTSETVSWASEKNVVVLECLSGVSCR